MDFSQICISQIFDKTNVYDFFFVNMNVAFKALYSKSLFYNFALFAQT